MSALNLHSNLVDHTFSFHRDSLIGEARILIWDLKLPFAPALPVALAAYPGATFSAEYARATDWKRKVVTWISNCFFQVVSAALQVVAIGVNLVAATVLTILSIPLPALSQREAKPQDFAKGAFVSFDLLLLHLAGAVFPEALQLRISN